MHLYLYHLSIAQVKTFVAYNLGTLLLRETRKEQNFLSHQEVRAPQQQHESIHNYPLTDRQVDRRVDPGDVRDVNGTILHI